MEARALARANYHVASNMERAARRGAGLTIRRLCDLIGERLLKVLHAPFGLDAPLGSPRIYAAESSDVLSTGTCVLAVGTPFPSTSGEVLLDRADRAGACSVVFSLSLISEQDTDLLQRPLASRHITVLGKPPSASWSQLLEHMIDAEGAWLGLADTAQQSNGENLFDLCDAIDELVDATVVIESPVGRVAAYSSSDRELASAEVETILHRRIPAAAEDRLKRQGIYARLASQSAPLEVRLERRSVWTGVALRVRNQPMGVLWAFSGPRHLDWGQREALASMAPVVLGQIMRQLWYEEDQRIGPATTSLRMMLEGRLIATRSVEELGLQDGSTYAVVAFGLDGRRFEACDRSRLSQIVTLSCQVSRRPCFVVPVDELLYAIIGVRSDHIRLLKGLIEESCVRMDSSVNGGTHAAIGSCVDRLIDIARSRRESDRVLRVLGESPGHPRVATIDELRNELLLNEVIETVGDSPHRGNARIPTLLTDDGKSGCVLVEALWAYLLAQGNVPMAAQQLGTPVNTLRYRLRRLREVNGLRLEDPDERLAVELDLRWLMRSGGDVGDRLLGVYRAFAIRDRNFSRAGVTR